MLHGSLNERRSSYLKGLLIHLADNMRKLTKARMHGLDIYLPDRHRSGGEEKIKRKDSVLCFGSYENGIFVWTKTLFNSTKQNISLHINNIYKEKELDQISTVKEYLTVQTEGNRKVQRKLAIYNLDVIISVGYRVKSLRGTQFRIWANQVLKDYLLKGYAVNQRITKIENDVHSLKTKSMISVSGSRPIFPHLKVSFT